LKRLGKEQVDLYQIHFPFPTFSNAALMESLKEAVEEGLTRAVGVSNFSKEQMLEADDVLSRYNIPLASNQVQYSLASRDVEENGLLKACKERNIQLIAYSPLASGLLTDKALTRTDGKATKIQPLLETMKSIGAQHGNKSVTQVALNYLICKGALPIAGCKNAQQAKAHCEVLKFKLTDDEVATLQEKARTLKL
jgi:aryl-alcohol dehydrogenase-like predicted oxidoreductase